MKDANVNCKKYSTKVVLIYISIVFTFLFVGMVFYIIDSPKDEVISIEVQIDRIEKQDASTTIVPLWYYTLHSSDGEYQFYLCGGTSSFDKQAFDANFKKNDTLKLMVSKNQYEKNNKTKSGIWTFAVQKDDVDYLDYDKAINSSGINTSKDINTLWLGILFLVIGGIGWVIGLIYALPLLRQKLFRNKL